MKPVKQLPATLATSLLLCTKSLDAAAAQPGRVARMNAMLTMLLAVLLLAHGALAADLPADHAEMMTRGLEIFRKDVGPLLSEHCVKCHGGEKTKGDFDLVTREGLLQGGKEGEAVKPFDSKASWMMKLIRH